jgi:hypothetical protein
MFAPMFDDFISSTHKIVRAAENFPINTICSDKNIKYSEFIMPEAIYSYGNIVKYKGYEYKFPQKIAKIHYRLNLLYVILEDCKIYIFDTEYSLILNSRSEGLCNLSKTLIFNDILFLVGDVVEYCDLSLMSYKRLVECDNVTDLCIYKNGILVIDSTGTLKHIEKDLTLFNNNNLIQNPFKNASSKSKITMISGDSIAEKIKNQKIPEPVRTLGNCDFEGFIDTQKDVSGIKTTELEDKELCLNSGGYTKGKVEILYDFYDEPLKTSLIGDLLYISFKGEKLILFDLINMKIVSEILLEEHRLFDEFLTQKGTIYDLVHKIKIEAGDEIYKVQRDNGIVYYTTKDNIFVLIK